MIFRFWGSADEQSPIIVGVPLVYGKIHTNFAEISNFRDSDEVVVLSVPDIASISFTGYEPFEWIITLLIFDMVGSYGVDMDFDDELKAYSVTVWGYLYPATIQLIVVADKLGISGMTGENFRQHLTVQVYDVILTSPKPVTTQARIY